MGKTSNKQLDARLTAAEASLHELESTRAVHDEFLVSTMDELARFGEALASVRADLEKATGETARLAAATRDRREHLHAVEAQLQAAKTLGDVLEARAMQAESAVTDLQARLLELRLASAEELGAARGRERLSEDRLRTVQRQLSDALKRLRDDPVAAAASDAERAEDRDEEGLVVEGGGEDDEGLVDAEEDGEAAASGGEDSLSYERVWDSFRREAGIDVEGDPDS